ncbi:MAG: translation initiation factor IF-2, partial [Bacteroidales bacterium]|nr:translation initiation factor IF-2 [Bacteroidales bacterium]
EYIARSIAIGNIKELNVIVKVDEDGSLEALSDSLIKLSTEQVRVNVIHKAVGAISESDVILAEASDAVIIGFQVRPSTDARKTADEQGIEIRLYSVIYDAINDVKDGIEGMLEPIKKEEITGTAEVKQTFKISKVGTIAGCLVRDGKIAKTAQCRLIRDGIVVYTGDIASLKRNKDDAKEVSAGMECGIGIEKFNDIKAGDMIEAFVITEIKQTLD